MPAQSITDTLKMCPILRRATEFGSRLRVVAQEESAKASTERQETILKEQACANAIFRKQWRQAIYLAFELKQPRKLLGVLTEMLDAGPGTRLVRDRHYQAP